MIVASHVAKWDFFKTAFGHTSTHGVSAQPGMVQKRPFCRMSAGALTLVPGKEIPNLATVPEGAEQAQKERQKRPRGNEHNWF